VVKNKIIEVANLVKKYKKSEVASVDGVSFYVEEGAFFSLLGPNGAGKTTTISILTTLLSPTSGKATISGFDVDRQSAEVRKRIGVIFQNPSLDANLTAEENVRFHTNLYGLYPYYPGFKLMSEKYQKKIKTLAEVLGLEKDIFKPVKALSGGMKRKLEIIRSLMHEPKVLFLDEPTTGLDPVSRKSLWNYLQEIRKSEELTIFLTTHYLEEAEGSDYVCILDKGKVVSQGSPKEIKESLVENYIEMDAGNRNKLKEELLKHKYKVEGEGPFRVKLNGKSAQKIISSIKTPLSVLEIHMPSLEDAYVEIITGKK
jgi:ABC-2 type transport system ATP-binding protein